MCIRDRSENRAKSVVAFLVSKGIEKSRLNAKGFGSKKPVAENDTQDGRMLNRRTTIKIAE
jgi:outer membrane protein OmpA-like peptidoglycan-associated protein